MSFILGLLAPIFAALKPLFEVLTDALLKHFSGPAAVVVPDPKAVLDRVGPAVTPDDLATRYRGLLDVPGNH